MAAMVDRRKDIWKLLYSLVNCTTTDLNDVFAFINDILCKEHSLIRQSMRESTNCFQDTFILWLTNKLIKCFTFQDENILEKNLKIQHKLLNSCLINRPALFERLVTAYTQAIDQLIESYAKEDLSPDNPSQLHITAFTTKDTSLIELDEHFRFDCIQVSVEQVNDIAQALLQVVDHCLIVGYADFPTIFENSLVSIFKTLKECDIITKLYCFQYVKSVFRKTTILNEHLHGIFELTLKALTVIWEQLPVWSDNNCFSQETFNDLIDESSSLLVTLTRFHQQLINKSQILQHSFSLMEYTAELHRWQSKRLHYDLTLLTQFVRSLINFTFPLIHYYPEVHQNLLKKELTQSLKKSSESYFLIMRLLPPLITIKPLKEESQVLLRYLWSKIDSFPQKNYLLKHHYDAVIESIASLILMEHLLVRRQQQKFLNKSADLDLKNLPLSLNAVDLLIPLNLKKESVRLTLESIINKLKSISTNGNNFRDYLIRMAGLILRSDFMRNLLTQKAQLELLELLLHPLKSSTVYVKQSQLVDTCLDFLNQLQFKPSLEAQKFITTSIAAIIKNVFENSSSLNYKSKFSQSLEHFLAFGWFENDFLLKELKKLLLSYPDLFYILLKNISCINARGSYSIIATFEASSEIGSLEPYHWFSLEIMCHKCRPFVKNDSELMKYLENREAVVRLQYETQAFESEKGLPAEIHTHLLRQLFVKPHYAFAVNHLDNYNVTVEDCVEILTKSLDISCLHLPTFSLMVTECFNPHHESKFLRPIACALLQHTTKSLESVKNVDYQRVMLQLLACCTENGWLTEQWLYHFFKMTFFYLIHPNSKVAHEAVLCATEMCDRYSIQPIQLWNWYKRDALNLLKELIVYSYLVKGIRMTRSLKAFTNMLGFSCVQEFICKYYRLLVAMILPYCVKEPRCKGLIISISKMTRKPVSNLFIVSFLRTYSHIYLTEVFEVGNACIDLIIKCTGTDLNHLMNADVKQTVSEFLVYFNRSPLFVMQAFQCLLPRETGAKSLTSPTLEFTNFIADRFLGVITYFQTCLAEPNFEKSLKEEALYSLAQIMRLIGRQNVTQFRFKIMAMLSFVLTLHDGNLQNICLKIWHIFLHIVNIQELGPSLSRIVATLQPLLPQNFAEINDIYHYLILKNEKFLGPYIPNLYFLESEVNLRSEIHTYVKRQSDLSKTERSSFLEKLAFLHKQISNENLQVRIHGLRYLKNFISQHREEINHLTLDIIRVDPLLENIVDNLVSGSCHEDRSMHLASAKCLGELGAIDPSYMPSNYSFENGVDISLSIHTDDFAVLALTELCRAYQYKKETKYVDNFSLAIQETLSVFGISPKESKKLNVWMAIPKRTQQVMEPFLSSCYTASKREIKNSEHPLFKSNVLNSYEDWAFAWSCRLIDLVQNGETNHLLNSYKPSMKRDNNMLALFFPYILLHAVQECDEVAFQCIFEEFQAVFSYGGSDPRDHMQTECDLVCFKEFKSTKYSADNVPTTVLKKVSNFMDTGKKLETCTKLCSDQLDFLQRWLREWQRVHMVGGKISEADQRYKAIEEFMKKFNKFNVSKANYAAGDYSRALLYLEEYIEENIESRLQEQLSFLIEIHGKLMDSDSVEGAVYLKKTNLTLAEEILVNRIVDRPQETITCYEQLLCSDDTINQEHIKGMIDCYLRMDISATALLTFDGLWQKLNDQYTDDYFKECKSELLWRLGRYDELEDLLENSVIKSKITNWNIQCAEAFLLFRQPNNIDNASSPGLAYFQQQLDNIRSNILFDMRLCSGVNEYSYNNCYDEMIRLHMLDEVEKNKVLINNIVTSIKRPSKTGNLKEECMRKIEDFFNNWNARLNILQPMARVVEPIFCLRRNLLSETKRILSNYENHNKELVKLVNDCVNEEIGKLWIRSGQMNRVAGCLQQAQLSFMKAEPYKPLTLFLEKARLMWQKGEQTYTFKLLEENILRLESCCAGDIRKLDNVQRGLYAEAKFLQATYNAESMNICSELNLRYFKEALEGNRCSEKCYVHLAQYMEKIYDSYAADQREGEIGYRLLQDVMLNYAKGLKYGFANVYQSLPRLLSIWLDFTSYLATLCDKPALGSATAPKMAAFQEIARKMNDLINNCNNILSTSIFYTAFSQLLSRICHPSKEVYETLKNIIVKLIEHFPQQSLWMLLPVFKSCHSTRIKRCHLIFTDSRLDKPTFQKLLKDFNMLSERLIELTNKDVSFDRSYELSSLVRQLPRLFREPNFSEIMLPFEKYMQISFPINANAAESPSLNNNNKVGIPNSSGGGFSSIIPSNPFPYTSVYIRGIREEIVVLRSAAKPKKICIECSDGLSYNVMIKPKDDLRRDFRLMEFNGLVKRYLHQDSQARHRSLRIRTYAAIPFNEECGLVEWLPRLNSFRGICTSFYRMRGLGVPDRILRQCVLPQTESVEKKRALFTQKLLPRHPPLFHNWFLQQFPTPHSWYQARTAYVKTVAVMSMVGYILGLGDRHGENILFDETNGDAVHVDFNCLFNQGECFAYPEIVPFRLTHNMVFAMGPLGVEGLFRKCCEITLRVLKDEAKTLKSILRPFVYDLGNLNRTKAKSSCDLEITDPKAMLDVRRIEERLQGYVKKTEANGIPLSTEGQVNFLINEATDIDNLAAMYVGWGAYL